MKIKRPAAIILTAALMMSGTITSLAGVQVTQGTEISTKVGDDRLNNTFGSKPAKFLFKEFDPASGLLPVYQNVSMWMGQEYDEASLLFLNTSGEVAIPANRNWRLVSGFQKGQAFVKEVSTGSLVRVNTAGQETGRFAVGEEITELTVLPDTSSYSFCYMTGKAGGNTSQPENFKVVFVDKNGGSKTVELQGNYWNIGEFEANGYAPLFKMTGTYDTQWRIEGAENWETLTRYNTQQTDYLDINGVIHSGSMPGYQEKAAPEYIPEPYDIGLPLDRTTQTYTYRASGYDLKKVKTESFLGDIYEICDKSGQGTGVMIYSMAFATDSFVIGRAYDSEYVKNYNFTQPDPQPPYCFFYINQAE